MPRTVKEWIGKTLDSDPPMRVKLRVLERFDRRCHWSGIEIRTGDNWDCDHVIAIINGGENREKNLAPIIKGKAHNEKTAEDLKIKSKTARMAKRHYGLKPKGRGFQNGKNGRYKTYLTSDGPVTKLRGTD